MNYPLISEYVQSIKFSEENFDKLSNLRPVLDADSNPIMSSGNFAVVFKMEDRQSRKVYAIKCFLREQEGRDESYRLIASELEYVSSTYLTPIQYFEKELFVDTTQGNDTEFPVLLMDWVDGLTLDKYIRNNIHDPYKLALITYQFCQMGSWLLSQEFAHGDLKPDNIIVREDGQLVMVDYDGMFVPAMRGQKARELGCVDYRHPFRTEDVFDGSIDDFSIASIALSLKAISLKPELLNDFGADDRLLLSAKDYQNIGESECLRAIQSLSNDTELSQLLGLFYIAYGRNELNIVSYKIFNISEPKPVVTSTLESEIQLSTEVTEEDLANAVEDEFGVLYSKDGKRLLKCKDGLKAYSIRTNTNVICDKAFSCCKSLQQIEIPDSVKYVGDFAFYGCKNLHEITIPRSVEAIGKSPFVDCSLLNIFSYNDEFIFYNNIFLIDKKEEKLIACLIDLQQITIPNCITFIGDSAFRECKSLQQNQEGIYIMLKAKRLKSMFVLYSACAVMATGFTSQAASEQPEVTTITETKGENTNTHTAVQAISQNIVASAQEMTDASQQVIADNIAKKEEEERLAREKAEQEAIDIEPKTEIEYDDFAKMQFQVGEIISCEAVPKSKKLLCSQVKIGSQVRQIVSGIKAHYSPEEMVGKKVMVLVNLKPAKLAGVMSEGMILCAEDAEGNLALVTPEKNMPAGAEIC